MKNKIESVLLIDSNVEATRTNEKIFKATNLINHIAIAYNTENAINYVKQRLAVGKGLPNIIFLNINLPEMSGWDFLEKFSSQFMDSYKHLVYLINYNPNANDLIKGSLHPLTQGVINSPMVDFEIEQILRKHIQHGELYVS